MPLLRRLAPWLVASALVASSATSFAETGAVQRFLRGPLFGASRSSLRISPPRGGHVLLHREGKTARWFLQPGIVAVKPGVNYAVTAVRDGEVLFDSGVVAQPGVLDLVWGDADPAPSVSFHPAVALDPFGVGLVPAGALPAQSLRYPVSDAAFARLLDELQARPDEPSRWFTLVRYADGLWFDDAQIETLIGSFAFPLYRSYAATLLERRRRPRT